MEKETVAHVDGKRVLVIPDLHAPFVHKDAVQFCLAVREKYNMDTVVFLGDEADMHSTGRYPKDPDGMSAGLELERCIEALQGFYYHFPKAFVCTSNHTQRPILRMFEAGLPAKAYKSIKEILEAPKGWDYAPHWRIRDVIYEHGDAVLGGKYPYARLMEMNMESSVCGHHHHALGIHWHRTPHKLMFGMGSGWLGDEDSYAMAYAKKIKVKPILACTGVIDDQPVIFKMKLKYNGRWDGSIHPNEGVKGVNIAIKQ